MSETNADYLCSNCGHPVFFEDGNCVHVMRLNDGSCYFQDKSGTCGCHDAFYDEPSPNRKPSPSSSVGSMVRPVSSVPKVEPIPSIQPMEPHEPRSVHPVNFMLDYLLRERKYSLETSLTLVKIVEYHLMNAIVSPSSDEEK